MQKTDHGQPVDNDRLCEAITKAGSRCQNAPLAGDVLCAFHGGQGRRPAPSPAAVAWVVQANARPGERSTWKKAP